MSSMLDRVTGRTRFISDRSEEGLLHAVLVRSRHARSKINRIDAGEAAALPGVVAVFTAADFADETGSVPRFGPLVADQPVLAVDETLYQGEPVAIVVGTSRRAAWEGSRKVNVDCEELAPVITREAALSLPAIHHSVHADTTRATNSNVMGEWTFAEGDLDSTRRQASLIIENDYHAPFAHHFAIEIPAVRAQPEDEGVHVITAAQHPFIVRQVLASMLGIPASKVRVQATEMGGSFGSKGYPKLEPVAALLALKLKMPVEIALTAEEAFLTAQREASYIQTSTGFDNDGRILFQEIDADFLVGAYTDISARVVAKTGLHALTPYRSDAFRVRARGLFTNTPPTTAFRGFGAPHAVFAVESQLDIAARRLEMDPLEIRRINLRDKGEAVPGETPVDGDWKELLVTAAEEIGWQDAPRDGVGRGIALGLKSCVPATTAKARVRLEGDGSVTAYVGTTEMGQGTHATLVGLVSERLGVPVDRIQLRTADTSIVPFDALTASSRSVVHMGNALMAACDDIQRRVAELASRPKSSEEPGLTTDEGEEGTPVVQDIRESQVAAASIEAEGVFGASGDPAHPLRGRAPFYEVVATAVELKVDADTGMVEIQRVVHVTDAGKVLSPRRAAGLDEGGIVMGLGLALTEHLVTDPKSGRLLNGSSLDYRIPTIAEIPEMISLFQENLDGPGPGGAKGLGEGGILAVVPAVASAIEDCCGARITELPFTPERVVEAIRETDA